MYKKYFLYLLFSSFYFIADAQKNGSIITKQALPIAGAENYYTYHPLKGLILPKNLYAVITYRAKESSLRIIPMVKSNEGFNFSFTTPDSTSLLIIGIADEKNEIFDNNNGIGYFSYLYDQNGVGFKNTAITKIALLDGVSRYYLKLNISDVDLIEMYRNEFKKNPAFKTGMDYFNYFGALYRVKKDNAKPQLLIYAKKMEAKRNDESKLLLASKVYLILKMTDEKRKLENKIISLYPNGELAKQRFWKEYYATEQRTENFALESMLAYFKKFKDSSIVIKDIFYADIISSFITINDTLSVLRIEPLVSNTYLLANRYNQFAWRLIGENLNPSDKDLEFAKFLSSRAVGVIEKKISNPTLNDDKQDLLSSYDMYADTYALILFKQQKYDSAFYYQNKIIERGQINIEGKERYAMFIEKSKGAEFAKKFIEDELLGGVGSPKMIQQLQGIYKQLNLPDNQYEKLKEKADSIIKQATEKAIKKKFGTLLAKNFSLKNLKGELISLSSLKGKIVILDFWAIWCGPCIASFPAIQQVINKYKEDDNIVFLFIDTWEDKEEYAMKKNADNFIRKNNYSFQILLDIKDKVVTDYKVEGIPTTFIIGRNGAIVYMGHSTASLISEIEAAKKLNY